eukprot:COSAG01_NODE_30491_length_615_cov_0.705426_1_plen_114_part_10
MMTTERAEEEEEEPLVREPAVLVSSLMAQLKGGVQLANQLPNEAEFEYHSSLLSARADTLGGVASRLCGLIRGAVLACGAGAMELQPGDDTEDSFDAVIDSTVMVLEPVGGRYC